MRAVHWNIEKALRRAGIERALREEPGLADADLVLLNEVDVGMARSGNLDVAASLGAALGRFAAWAPMFLEITAGRDDDVAAAGGRGNAEGLLGLAGLSRWPLGAVRVVELPSPSEFQFEVERMFGRHVALVAEVLRPGAPFVAVAAHLEVHRGRAHRAAQVRAAAEALRGETRPVILGGDFNTHTFDRGVPLASLRAGLPLLLAPEAALERRFVRPFEGRTREFLFDELRDAGFAWEPFTDFAPTLRLRFERVREARGLSTLLGPFRNAVLARMERRALLKLDWFAGRGWSGGRGWTVVGLDGPEGLSDHAPVGAEFR
ncbi:MAG: endonuclease/exonuclease/phosphatase family protein [Candidatus Eisenbacteria bacterium]|nr:endonuclease/exonuclease/phosphatase family protein [Candidatus Eisenbacteria bacterium]